MSAAAEEPGAAWIVKCDYKDLQDAYCVAVKGVHGWNVVSSQEEPRVIQGASDDIITLVKQITL